MHIEAPAPSCFQDPALHTELALTAIELATAASVEELSTAALTPDSLRTALQQHLGGSVLYDVQRVLAAVRGGGLAAEQVILYRKVRSWCWLGIEK